jgi:hypothetical protein
VLRKLNAEALHDTIAPSFSLRKSGIDEAMRRLPLDRWRGSPPGLAV